MLCTNIIKNGCINPTKEGKKIKKILASEKGYVKMDCLVIKETIKERLLNIKIRECRKNLIISLMLRSKRFASLELFE